LIDAQENYARDGVCKWRLRSHVRPPKESELRDSGWRPIDVSKDNIEEHISGVDEGETYPEDRARLYYWRESYWRR
jgi:hypothetical protein